MTECKLCGKSPGESYEKVKVKGVDVICHHCLAGDNYSNYKSKVIRPLVVEHIERPSRV